MPYKASGRPHLRKTKSVERLAVTLTLPLALVQKVDVACEKHERSRSQIVEFALRSYLEPVAAKAARVAA